MYRGQIKRGKGSSGLELSRHSKCSWLLSEEQPLAGGFPSREVQATLLKDVP